MPFQFAQSASDDTLGVSLLALEGDGGGLEAAVSTVSGTELAGAAAASQSSSGNEAEELSLSLSVGPVGGDSEFMCGSGEGGLSMELESERRCSLESSSS